MLVKIFGGIDIIIGLVILFERVLNFSNSVLLFFGIVLIIKAGFGLFKNFASWIDLFCALVIFFSMVFLVPIWINVIAGILLIQKGGVSFI